MSERTIVWGGASRLVAILAVASLAGNLLVAGAYIGSSHFAEDKPSMVDRRVDRLAERLDVDPDSDAGMTELHQSIKIAFGVQRLRNQPLLEDILAEFIKPKPDLARIGTLQDRVMAYHRATGDEVLTALLTFLRQAPAGKRAELIEMLREPKDPDAGVLRYGLLP